MTMPYEDNPMPNEVAVTCASCGEEALFAFMECIKIKLNQDINYFKQSKIFDYKKTIYDGVGINLACYYHRLDQNSFPEIDDLPEGYFSSDWGQKYSYRDMFNFKHGAMVCSSCGVRRKHDLSWPNEAYFSIDYKGNYLWAYDRSHAVELLDYIASKDRDRSKYKHRSFLLHLPAIFQTHKARDYIIKHMSAKLRPARNTKP